MSETRAFEYLDPTTRDMMELRSDLESAHAEITSLRAQLEEAQKERDELKSRFLSLSEFKAKYLEGRQNPVEEARAKAIEECIAIADAELADPKSSGRQIAKLLRTLIAGSTK